MAIQLKPETEKLVRQELQSGRFHSVDEIILQGVRARREKERAQRTEAKRRQAIEHALDFAQHRAVPLEGISIKQLLHEGHRL